MLLEATDISVTYGSTDAIVGTTIAVGHGEVVGLVGRNGAGKTSLLGAITGVVPMVRGTVRLEGRPVKPHVSLLAKRGIAYVPEDRRLFGSLTVLENLRLGATGTPKEGAARIRRELQRFPVLDEMQHRVAAYLSGGQQQMLAISRALVSRPRLLLLDEPTLGLSPSMVDQIFRVVDELRAEGLSVLLVEQNVGRTVASADRTYLMASGGHILVEGRREELRADDRLHQEYFRSTGMSVEE